MGKTLCSAAELYRLILNCSEADLHSVQKRFCSNPFFYSLQNLIVLYVTLKQHEHDTYLDMVCDLKMSSKPDQLPRSGYLQHTLLVRLRFPVVHP